MTRQEAIEKHREMWNWIANETERREACVKKYEYFDAHNGKSHPSCLCYCCEYGHQQTNARKCYHCPIQWTSTQPLEDLSNIYPCVDCDESPFVQWDKATTISHDWESAARFARKIANLPENIQSKLYESL